MSTWPIPKLYAAENACVRKPGLSGPEVASDLPIPNIPNYVCKFDPDDPSKSFESIGIRAISPKTSVFGNGYTVPPGSIDIAMHDGVQFALLPGRHAYRMMRLRLKPYVFKSRLTLDDRVGGTQTFDGGFKITVGPNQVGLLFNVPTADTNEAANAKPEARMGGGIVLLPPGIWLTRAPVKCAMRRFEVSTTFTGERGDAGTLVQELGIEGLDAKPRLMYVPYNHSAIFIDGTRVQICDQGFHWAAPGIEIAGPWPHAQQRLAFEVGANTLDNIAMRVEVECWIQLVDPETYVRMAGKEALTSFVRSKISARITQHVAQIHALSATIRKLRPDAAKRLVPVGELMADAFVGENADEQMITTPLQSDSINDEESVMSRMKSVINEVRGFVDGRVDSPYSLAVEAQEVMGEVGVQIVQVAALMVRLPQNIEKQMTDANELTIRAQSEMGISEARAEQHIAAKMNEIKKKKVDRDEEMRDAENKVNVQRALARLAEAEEFAKRQAKRAEQKVEQALEMQALEHKQVREQKRIATDIVLLNHEKELLALQDEMEESRMALEKKRQQREALAADTKAYTLSTLAKAEREKVNKQTLLDSIMTNLGKPLQGSKIVSFVGGAGEGSSGDVGLMRSVAPQVVMMREILSHTDGLLNDGARSKN